MNDLLTDPVFYLTAIPSVILIGLSKGGLGGAMALIGVPLMSLTMPPVQAAAILLPIFVLMDIISLWAWRGYRDVRTLKIMLPGALIGIAIAWATAALVTEAMVRLLIGAIAFLFAGRWFLQKLSGNAQRKPHRPAFGVFWSVISGFTSFVAHAGGPPYQVYTLPLGQDPKIYTGTSVIFFAVLNAVKLIPYFALGQLGTENLAASLALAPVAPVATFAGAWIVKRLKADIFYPFMYTMVLAISLELIWVGLAEFVG